ncbi:hypothetical protein D3C85_913880 [compost metagenome]
MPVGVVDVFEMIHVQHHRTQRQLIVLAMVVEALGLLEKRPAILQAGQFVSLCGACGNAVGQFHFTGQAEGRFQRIGEFAGGAAHE